MKLITVATHESGYYKALQESAAANGFELITLGLNEKWQGFMMKVTKVLEYAKQVPPQEIITYIDAYDCIVLGNPDELKSKYEALNTNKIIFSASHGNFLGHLYFGKPVDKYKNEYYNSLCAGTFIGRASAITRLFENVCKNFDCKDTTLNDQNVFTDYHTKLCQECVDIDYNCNIFYNIDFNTSALVGLAKIYLEKQDPLPLSTDLYHFDPKTKRIHVHKKTTTPVILHGNGNLNLDEFVKALGYSPKKAENRNYKQYSASSYTSTALKKIALYLIYFIHVAYFIIIVYGAFYFKSPILLSILILINMITVTQWYMQGYCILSPIENWLAGEQRIDPTTKRERSYILDVLEYKLGLPKNILYTSMTLAPLFLTTVILIRLKIQYKISEIAKKR